MKFTSANKFKALIMVLCLSIVTGGFGQAFASSLAMGDMAIEQAMPAEHAMAMQHDGPTMVHPTEGGPCISTAGLHDCCADHSNCASMEMSCVTFSATACLSNFKQPVLVLGLRGTISSQRLEKPALADIAAPFRPPRY